MAVTSVDKSMTYADPTTAVACVKLTKSASLKGFTFSGLSIYAVDPSTTGATALSSATRNFTVPSAIAGQSCSIYVTAARGTTAPSTTTAASQTGTDGVPTSDSLWREWQGSSMSSIVANGEALFIAFNLLGVKEDVYLRDADTVLWARAIVLIPTSGAPVPKELIGKITITTLGNITFSWV